ncbi:hypothetical protein KCQ_17302 [Pectobacterium atrosepticum ICMP 1526]|nr:hypothetical protein KCQ_17302 [Pectobacterium atrosepticum ICMP 1526]
MMDERGLTVAHRKVALQMFSNSTWAQPDDPQILKAIVELFTQEVEWDISGDVQVVPWSDPRRNREEVASFFRELAKQIIPERFEVWRIVADDDVAVALGELASRVKRTGRLIELSSVLLSNVIMEAQRPIAQHQVYVQPIPLVPVRDNLPPFSLDPQGRGIQPAIQ